MKFLDTAKIYAKIDGQVKYEAFGPTKRKVSVYPQ